MSGEEFVSNATQRVLIALPTDCTAKLLWGHVRGSSIIINIFDTCRRKHSGDAKIGQQHIALRVEEDVFWLEIPVNDVLLMSVVECLPDLRKYPKTFIKRQHIRQSLIQTIAKGTGRGV